MYVAIFQEEQYIYLPYDKDHLHPIQSGYVNNCEGREGLQLHTVDPGGHHTRFWIRGSRVRARPGPVDFFQSVKILSMTSFGREESRGSRVVYLRHVKEPQVEIRASEQNLSDFSRSMSEATLMTQDVKKVS